MKFTDGYWLVRKGYEIQNPADIRDIVTDDASMTVYAATHRIEHKGDTLNGALLKATYSSPMPNVIRVRLNHHKGRVHHGPDFEIHTLPTEVAITVGEDVAVLKSGDLSVRVGRGKSWDVGFYVKDRKVTGSGHRGPGYITDPQDQPFFREQLELGMGEYVYGLGERFTPFVKNGQVVDIWNEDGGTSSEQAYKNIPFYLSNKGYGVFVNHPEKVSYEIASENVSKVQFSVSGESLEYFIIGGANPKEVLDNYTKLTGKPALPPAWTFGLWLTTSFTTDYDEATVNHFVDGMAERDLPLSVFHFDCFWMKEYQWCDFQWDQDMFPDPEGMLQRLKAKGLKICAWINPYIAEKSILFDEGMENGYLVKTADGSVWQWDMWQAGMGLVDFTNPAAVAWYQDKLKVLIDQGVDCFKTDFGERIPTDVVYYDGSDPMKMHNYYTHLYNKAVFDVLEEKLGKNEAALFARSATAGGQQFPVHWGGDCSSTYESMAESLRGGLSLGLSGFGFWSHDISGFELTAAPDLYKRWVQFGLLSSHSRLHGNVSYRVPWLFDEESVDVVRSFTKLKCSLMPHLYAAAVESSVKGLPMMRAMVLEFPQDPTCATLDLQYMLGDSILVAPIFNKEGNVQYYVPEGQWTNLLTNEIVSGGRWVNEQHDFTTLPVLVKPNTLLAIGHEDRRPDYDYADQVALHLFELGEGQQARTVIVNTSGEEELTVTASRKDSVITVKAEGAVKPWSLVLRGIHEAVQVKEGTSLAGEQGLIITPASSGQQELTIHLA
ncbi:alpha-xylosidase [Paenibacillus polymyxa]|uniref:alpha-D-xyloside xylohydrolase n=1 Tax=Paenibacillus polymyxa (strain SC2) TaxID=886882 RepID=E3EIV0_PAEPS|nr:alpha-xylosidase [Paenibacillus polymyxa]ADO55969.1 alpha-glucosidase [Paenibacillus polymyxa SC2]WPQ58675.1 alpha-xylosidase [Paenibacillus polymyxa]CCC84733.1 lysosomal alpha-glucosidase Gaa [Paenibacillus polymyxa M1]